MIPLPIEEVILINEMNDLQEELIDTRIKTPNFKKYMSQAQAAIVTERIIIDFSGNKHRHN